MTYAQSATPSKSSNLQKQRACVRNVGEIERLASAAVGGGLLLYGLKKRGIMASIIGGGLLYRGASGHCELYHKAGINTAAQKSSPQTSVPHGEGEKLTTAVTIDRPAAELYAFWRELSNLPRFMSYVESVETLGNGRSRWRVKVVGGKTISWDAEFVNDIPGQLIAWRTVESAEVDHAGSVRFESHPGGRGTQVKVTMEYRPIAGDLGIAAAKLLGADPKKLIETDLQHFKQLMESGEISSVEGQPHG